MATYAPGARIAGVGPHNATVGTDVVWFSYIDPPDGYDRGITKVTRNYARLGRHAATRLIETTRMPTLPLAGDVDDAQFPLLLPSAIGPLVSSVYTLGKLNESPSLLDFFVARGKTDTAVGASTVVYYDRAQNARVNQLVVFLEEGGGRLRYTADIRGIFYDETFVAASGISFSEAGKLFSHTDVIAKYRTAGSSGSYTEVNLNSFRLTINQSAEAHYTTVKTAIQGNADGVNDPTNFNDGDTSAMLELTFWAKDAPTILDDFHDNNAIEWVITCTSNPAPIVGATSTKHDLTFTILNSMYMPANVAAGNGRGNEIMQATAVAIYNSASTGGMTAAFGVTP